MEDDRVIDVGYVIELISCIYSARVNSSSRLGDLKRSSVDHGSDISTGIYSGTSQVHVCFDVLRISRRKDYGVRTRREANRDSLSRRPDATSGSTDGQSRVSIVQIAISALTYGKCVVSTGKSVRFWREERHGSEDAGVSSTSDCV